MKSHHSREWRHLLMRTTVHRRGFLGLTAIGGGIALTGCGFGSTSTSKGPEELIAWPLKNVWPELLERLHPDVQETYKWVAANEETIRWFPCTCGCVETDNHTSNFDCYVAEKYDDGSVLLDQHSFG